LNHLLDRNTQRLGVALSLGLWLGALLAPASEVISASRYTVRSIQATYGYHPAAFGWAGPLGLCIAWYGNLPYLYSILRTVRGEAVPRRLALISLLIAGTVLLPHGVLSEVDGWHRASFTGPAIWLWLAAFAVNCFVAYS
jgi:hypothetical protein